MQSETNANAAAALALGALGWILDDPGRAKRFVALTGLTPDRLRAALDEPATHEAVIGFLEAHEPDLIACAAALGAEPAELVAARREVAR